MISLSHPPFPRMGASGHVRRHARRKRRPRLHAAVILRTRDAVHARLTQYVVEELRGRLYAGHQQTGATPGEQRSPAIGRLALTITAVRARARAIRLLSEA
jgi:hypothetical protein